MPPNARIPDKMNPIAKDIMLIAEEKLNIVNPAISNNGDITKITISIFFLLSTQVR
ncbi:MAG: hypothetical protein ACI9T8_000306 [Candidatus Saccharimonadales bacterium]|jgi:hypothetical protein